MTIVNDDPRVVKKLEASLSDGARVVIYDRHMFIVQATVLPGHKACFYKFLEYLHLCYKFESKFWLYVIWSKVIWSNILAESH
jgi:hypothetical protein